jgi:uncharacterized RDD family membrane protein YckC
LGFLIFHWLSRAGLYVPVVLFRQDILSIELYEKLSQPMSVINTILSSLSLVLILIFIIELRSITRIPVVEGKIVNDNTPPPQPVDLQNQMEGVMRYAGFWNRFAASIIDIIITLIGGWTIGFVFGVMMALGGTTDIDIITGLANLLGIIINWLYFALMESSSSQGTLGKMVLGIKVTDLNGNRVSFGKATGRHFGKIISVIVLGIGYIMVAFTEKKQGLHDMMAGCLVVNRYAVGEVNLETQGV